MFERELAFWTEKCRHFRVYYYYQIHARRERRILFFIYLSSIEEMDDSVFCYVWVDGATRIISRVILLFCLCKAKG
jgi:hypothetical protein